MHERIKEKAADAMADYEETGSDAFSKAINMINYLVLPLSASAFVCLLFSMHDHLSACLPICQSACHPLYMSVCLSDHLSLIVCVSACLYVRLGVFLSVSFSHACLSFCL